jgi:hypothetical protein
MVEDMPKPITVVSGLPRSGTSLVMQMLSAGGMPAFTDSVRQPDVDNPRGYFECERVKHLASGASWLEGAGGMAVKVVSPLLTGLPADFEYKIIFLSRPIGEVLLSQRQMLAHRNEPAVPDDARMAEIFSEHLAKTLRWIAEQPHMLMLSVPYRRCILDALGVAFDIMRFLDRELDVIRMAAAVDPALYRQRLHDEPDSSSSACGGLDVRP